MLSMQSIVWMRNIVKDVNIVNIAIFTPFWSSLAYYVINAINVSLKDELKCEHWLTIYAMFGCIHMSEANAPNAINVRSGKRCCR